MKYNVELKLILFMKKIKLLITAIITFIIVSCTPEKCICLPQVSTNVISAIESNSAISGGNIISDGGSKITSKGIVWSSSHNPTISLTTKTIENTNSNNFTSNLKNLDPNTTYYIRAYATNNLGTAYGDELSFTTKIDISSGLMAYFPFNGNTNDESGNNNATNNGAILSDDRFGNLNSSYKFSTNTDIIYIPNTTLNPQEFSVSLWFKINSAWSYTTLNLFGIFKNSNSLPGGFAVRLDQNDGAYGLQNYKIYTSINDASSNFINTQNFTFSELNMWKNLIVTKSGTEIKFYLNGALIKTGNLSGVIDFTNSYLQIGNKRNINNNLLGERQIDDIRLYNRILSQTEITYLYNH